MYDIIIEHKPQQKLMPWLFNQGLYHSRVSCKKCAAGVKQIDDTISDGGKRIPTYTIKKGVIKQFFWKGSCLEFL